MTVLLKCRHFWWFHGKCRFVFIETTWYAQNHKLLISLQYCFYNLRRESIESCLCCDVTVGWHHITWFSFFAPDFHEAVGHNGCVCTHWRWFDPYMQISWIFPFAVSRKASQWFDVSFSSVWFPDISPNPPSLCFFQTKVLFPYQNLSMSFLCKHDSQIPSNHIYRKGFHPFRRHIRVNRLCCL